MKRVLFAVLAFALVVAVDRPALASPQTVEGVVSDSMCGKKHMLPGKTDAQCIKECIGSSKYALVSGDKLYTLSGPVSEFEKYAGKKVRITGEIGKDAIIVNSIGEAPRR